MTAAATERPPYRVPTLAEVKRTRLTRYRAVSTFSGAGGTSTGFRMAGVRVLYAVEFVALAAESYRANWPSVHVDERDVRDVTAGDIRAVIGDDELDILEGSPPCDPFSQAGKRDRDWGRMKRYSSDKVQRTDDLTFDFARLAAELRPRVFVMENVRGLIAGRAKGYYLRIREALEEAGYVIEARVLEAQWLGVPQHRERVIIIGIRRDLHDAGMRHRWPTPLPYRYSLRDAIGVEALTLRGWRGHRGEQPTEVFERPRSGDEPSPGIQAGGYGGVARERYRITARTSGQFKRETHDPDKPAHTIGANAGLQDFRVEPLGPVVDMVARQDFQQKRHELDRPVQTLMSPDRNRITVDRAPSPAVAASRYHGFDDGVTHVPVDMDDPSPTLLSAPENNHMSVERAEPDDPTKLTIAEVKALGSFPPDYVLTGGYKDQWERVGQSVPPLMAKAYAASIVATLRAFDEGDA